MQIFKAGNAFTYVSFVSLSRIILLMGNKTSRPDEAFNVRSFFKNAILY